MAVGPFGKWVFLVGFWAAVFSALLGVWQSLPYLFTDLLWLRAGRGIGQRGDVDVSRSLPYRDLPRVSRHRSPGPFCAGRCRSLQLAFGLTGLCCCLYWR